jgi:hypothetical protein
LTGRGLKVLFLSYGVGLHQQEVQFAVQCLQLHQPVEPESILVYTDTPHCFASLPAQVVEITSEQWRNWGGPRNFNHRRKILALDHALEAFGQPVLLLDGDTWLRQPLSILESRIGPRRGVMHIREGQISRVQSPLYDQLRQLLQSSAGQATLIPVDAWMWNAGVIGLHPEQRSLLQEVLRLTDLLCEHSSLHILEQLAFSVVLSRNIQLQEAADVVFHYWPPYLHKPFRQRLPVIMTQASLLPESRQAAFLYSHRPRPGLGRRCKVICKRLLESIGLLRGYCRSNEW